MSPLWASESPHPVTGLPQGLTQLSDFMKERSKPGTPTLSQPPTPWSPDPSSPTQSGPVCVTCHSRPLTHPAAWEGKNVSPKTLHGRCLRNTVILVWMRLNVASHKLLVRGQQVELGSTEVPLFIWSAEWSPRVYPDADCTYSSSNVRVCFPLPVLLELNKMRKRDVSH